MRRSPPSLTLRPRLERLEDRTVPSTFTATNYSDLVTDINAANAAGGANTINLVPGVTYTLGYFFASSGQLVHGLPVIGANDSLTIHGQGDVIERSTTGQSPVFGLFSVAAGASLTMDNMTMQGGYSYYGGGAISNQGNLTLNGVTVQNNTARGPDGTPTHAGGSVYGGGIYSTGTLTLDNCIIRQNSAIGGKGGDGALVSGYYGYYYAPGGAGGYARGGSIYIGSGTVAIHHTTITANSATGGAGGNGSHGSADGLPGLGEGGGIYISAGSSVGLDAFTVSHVQKNKASTSGDNVVGTYSVIP